MRASKKTLFRNLAMLVAVPLLLAGLVGCIGSDGDDGLAYLRIQGDYLQAYGDNNPGIPSPFYLNTYYQSSPGTYTFEYIAGGYYHRGTYTISINEGESGKFLQDGDDGDDKYFSLYCGRAYPTITTDAGSVASAAGSSITKGEVSSAPLSGTAGTQVVTQGRYTLTLKYQ